VTSFIESPPLREKISCHAEYMLMDGRTRGWQTQEYKPLVTDLLLAVEANK